MTRAGRRLRLGALWLLLVGCGPRDQGAEQGALGMLSFAHRAGEPTRLRAPNPLDWVETDLEEFDRLFPGRLSGPRFLPLADPQTQRAQRFADRLVQALLERYPERLAPVPRPLMRIRINPAPNGLVSPLSVCLRCPVSIPWAPGELDQAASELVGFNQAGLVFPILPSACADRTSRPVAAEAVAESLRRNLAPCALETVGGELVVGPDCRLAPRLRGRSFPGLALTATANVVILTTGLLETARSEEELAGVLLHELAHYFRSHPALCPEKHSFFYRLTDDLSTSPPTPDPALQEVGQRLIRATRRPRLYPVASQQLHSGLFPAIRDSVIPGLLGLCSDGTCGSPCAGFLSQDPGTQARSFGEFPSRPLGPDARPRYLGLEDALLSCARRIALGDDPNAPALLPGQAAQWLGREAEDLLPQPSTLGELLGALSEKREQEDQAVEDLLQLALDQGIGYYTHEQEADELAVEWLSLLGVEPRALIEQLFGLMERLLPLELDTRFDLGFRRCRELYQRGWIGPDGQRPPIPIGSFADPHHGLCYRIFNIDQQIRAHGFGRRP